MTQGDINGLILSYVYPLALLLIVEFIGKKFKWHQEFTRKIIHMGAGLWIWGILYFFDNWQYGIIPIATFIILNFLFYKYQIFKAMDTAESTPGTVYFAVSSTILIAWLWRTDGTVDHIPIAAAAIMAMTIGDALANIIGRQWGKHKYTIWGTTRSFEGSAAMAVSSFIVIGLTLFLLPGTALSTHSIPFSQSTVAVLTLAGGITAVAAESVSPKGTDNLFVPLLSAVVMYFLAGALTV